MRVHSVVFMAALAVRGTLPLSAHHSVKGSYDTTNTVSLSGIIAKVSLVNPHATIEISGKDVEGKPTTWLIEMAGPNALTKRGFDPKALTVGLPVMVEVWIAKDGEKRASGRTLITPDGKRLNIADNWPDMVFPNEPTR